jgi:hypothetical protein
VIAAPISFPSNNLDWFTKTFSVDGSLGVLFYLGNGSAVTAGKKASALRGPMPVGYFIEPLSAHASPFANSMLTDGELAGDA